MSEKEFYIRVVSTIIGKYFGYPDCCVEEFIEKRAILDEPKQLTSAQKKVIDYHGYVPCNKCALKLIKQGKKPKDLISKRICKTPYPNPGKDKDFDKYLNKNLYLLI